MSAAAAAHRGPSRGPKILVFSTNNVSDPGVDLAGSAHVAYSSAVRVISVPCSSGIDPRWILHALEKGFDGVFIAADGSDCSKIANCSERTGIIVARAQQMMREAGHEPARLKMAAVCTVCAEPFAQHMEKFGKELEKLPVRAATPVVGTPVGPAAPSATAARSPVEAPRVAVHA